MSYSARCYGIFAGLSGFVGVVLGAAAAHKAVDTYAADLLRQASLYQLIHSVMLFMICERAGLAARIARPFFAVGTILFCGGLAAKAMTGIASASHVVPFGGGCLMLGWIATAAIFLRRQN